MVSVILPVYNSEKYLEECLESVISQSYAQLEIIIIDDGSTDNSSLICDRFANKDSRIVVKHILNGGVSKAVELGVKTSLGDYVCFIDSDDFYHKDFIKNLLMAIEENRADIAMCNFYDYVDGQKKPRKKDKSQTIERSKIEASLSSLLFVNDFFIIEPCRWNKIYRRSMLLAALEESNSNAKIAEDLEMNFVLLLKAKKVAYIEDVLYYYRYVNNSITNSKKSYWNSYYSVFLSCLKKASGDENLEILLSNFIVNILSFEIYDMIKKKKKSKDIKQLLKISEINKAIKKVYKFSNKKRKILLKLYLLKMVSILKIYYFFRRKNDIK